MTTRAAESAETARAPGDGRTKRPGRRFDERFVRRLESLALAVRRASAGGAHGSRRGQRLGAGVELADHRDYAPGDDLRYLDWNLYGRLERLALRVFEEDQDLSVDLLVDVSASMGMGTPPKLELALQVSAALAYVALGNLDRVAVTALGVPTPGPPPGRGRARILPILRHLEAAEPRGRASLETAVRGFLARRRERRRGLAIVVSDFYDRAGPEAALELLRHRRVEIVAVQVSAPDETAPTLRGDLRLCDVETGEEQDLTLSPRALAEATRRHAALLRRLAGYCREHAIPCFAVSSEQPFDAAVLRMFRAGGLFR